MYKNLYSFREVVDLRQEEYNITLLLRLHSSKLSKSRHLENTNLLSCNVYSIWN